MESEQKEQRFAKSLDNSATTPILMLITDAENLIILRDTDGAFNKLDFADRRLPDVARLDMMPSIRLQKFRESFLTLGDYRKKEKQFMRLSPQALTRQYYYDRTEQEIQLFKEVTQGIIDSMQKHQIYLQETRRWHKSDAPQVSVI